MIIALVLMFIGTAFAQKSTYNPITLELQKELDRRTASDELFRITIVMADEYDQTRLSNQLQYMNKGERRAYVIGELQRYAVASQYELMQLLEAGVKAGTVSELSSFWIFNGISCVTNRDMIFALSKRNDVGIIESDEIRDLLPANEKPSKITNLSRDLAWHVSQVNADDVWTMNGTTGYDGTGIVVAIIDTGVNYNHTDLSDHMWNGGSSYPYHGYDFFNNDNNPMDDNGHGSHCAGIVAGDGTSGTQTGIAPNATIMALKVLDEYGGGSWSNTYNAIQFAINNNADVVSMSLGGSGQSGDATFRQLFVNMMNVGIVASIAAGNEGEFYSTYNTDEGYYYPVPRNVGSPGNCPSPWHNPDQTLTGGLSACVTVGASNRNDVKSTFSSFGPVTWSDVSGYNDYPYTSGSSTNIGLIKPDVIAPGTDITSLDYSNTSGYVSEAGTSMATPCVAGIMALMLQADNTLTPAEIDEILETTALPVEYRTSKNNYTGAGRVDALAAVEAVLTTVTQPTNLVLETCGGDVNLTWTPSSSSPSGYCIYRDNVQVGSTTETSYTDANVGTGKHVYFVRAIDNSNRQSVHSNSEVCTIAPYATVPEDLTISWDGANAELEWSASTVSNVLSETDLYYTNSYDGYFGSNYTSSKNYWGIRFLPEDLRGYEGMSINQVSFYATRSGYTYNVYIYRGTTNGNTTGSAVKTAFKTPQSTGWQTISLSSPYSLDDISTDLWIVIGSPSGIPVAEYAEHNSNSFYVAANSSTSHLIWNSYPDFDYHYACCIKAHLTRTTTYTPTYNVYLDNGSEATGLGTTSYTDQPTLHSGENTYNVTSMVNSNESCASNDATIVVVDDTETASSLAIDESLVFIIEAGGILTVNGSLTNANPGRLIIKDGGQLFHYSSNVQATIQKDITAFTSGNNDGWYTIATPFTIYDPADELAINYFDLYSYDEDGDNENLEWINYKNGEGFNLAAGWGYLYANGVTDIYEMTGTLNSGNYTSIRNLGYANNNNSIKGFNLLGNPTAHSISYLASNSVSDGYYYLSNDNAWTYTTTTTVPTGRGFLVKANAADQTVTLNPQSKDEIIEKGEYVSVSVDDATAYVKLNEGVSMPLLDFKGSHSSLYFTRDGKSYIMLVRNSSNALDLSFEARRNGIQTLTVDVNGIEVDYLHLIDHLTGADVDLLQTPSYTFTAKTTDYASRFQLVFSVSGEAGGDNESFAFYNGSAWVITNGGEAILQIIDVTGRILCSETVSGNATISTGNLSAGVYVMRLVNGEGVKTQKIVVK